MHNHDAKYPARQGFEPGTSMLQVSVDTNEPSGQVIRPWNWAGGRNIAILTSRSRIELPERLYKL